MRFVLGVGTTDTATIDGISAAGASPSVVFHTPSADAELVAFGHTVRAPVVPVSPTGCPTPALVTRAVHESIGFDLLTLDAGLRTPTASPTVDLNASPGGDIREADPVPTAAAILETARDLARSLADDDVMLAESIPGGTTTALGVLRALGEPFNVSSSHPDNPLELKNCVVEEGLKASDHSPGTGTDPLTAVRRMGDPVLAAVTGYASGAIEAGTDVTLAGGTQMLAVAALLRHTDHTAPLTLATTPFVDADPTIDLQAATDALDIDLTVTDPTFEAADHVAMARYCRGEAKEGVGMGGALAHAANHTVPMATIRDTIVTLYDRVVEDNGP